MTAMIVTSNGGGGGGGGGGGLSTNSFSIQMAENSDEHEELLAEMELIERLPTQERLKQAKRRRALQMKRWAEFEKQEENELNGLEKESFSIKFQDHIVLLDAIMRKDYDEVERLLRSRVSPNSANEDGLTAIHQCCIDDSADLLRLLIRYGADVNVCDNDMWTPLHAAATCANLDICKILIENRAELLAVNTDGNMPYDICDDEVCLEYIESEMAKRGVTQQAIDMKRSEIEMKMLEDLKRILYFNAFDSSVNNDVIEQFTNVFRNSTLSDGRLDLNAKDANGATLMHIACANGYTTILEFLLIQCPVAAENGVAIVPPSISVTDNDGWTPLHVAAFWGHQKAIEILLEHRADINLATNNDETVLELCDDLDIRDFIVQKSKEIELSEQQEALAKQQQQQLVISSDSSFKKTNSAENSSLPNAITSSNSNINNSTRSLKRTSTGVSRSSSVRRSSFREKEKAARKLDTSFKDVLYASESQAFNTLDHLNEKLNAALGEEASEIKKQPNALKPHEDQISENNHNKAVVKIISNGGVCQVDNYSNKNNAFIDDHNNNKLKVNGQVKELKTNNNNEPAQMPVVNQVMVKLPHQSAFTEPAFLNDETKTRIVQPMPFQSRSQSEVGNDGVRHKFVSNETIGAKNSHNTEFYDMPDAANSKFGKCTKCVKCCYVM